MEVKVHSRTLIIAEAGVNHNGSIDAAFEMVDVAANAGVDFIKFQTFSAEKIVTNTAKKARYQIETTDSSETQFQMLKKLELSDENHLKLMVHCKKMGVQFLSTPFDLDSLSFLVNTCGVSQLKISSGDITNGPLLLASTGMSDMDEIERALQVLAYGYLHKNEPKNSAEIQEIFRGRDVNRVLSSKITLLQCTSEYPAPFNELNLKAMASMRNRFQIDVGLSDHSVGVAVPLAAVALGAKIIEKHFTLSKDQKGPDHQASLDPLELKTMVRSIREVEMALGSALKEPTPSEIKNRVFFRKSLVSATDLTKGSEWNSRNLIAKRPGSGISPMKYWDYLNVKADRDYSADEVIDGG